MENRDFNKELLDYLYGEMTAAEKKEFEQKLDGDDALMSELHELTAVRNELDKLKDKEVMEPFSAWSKSRSSGWFKSSQRRKMIVFRPITAVAASLVILMLVGYLTNFSLTINDQGTQLGFGKQSTFDSQQFFSKEEVKSILSQEMKKNNELLLARLTDSEQNYNSKLASLETNLNDNMSTNHSIPLTNEDLKKIFTNAESRNAETVKEYLKLTSAQQQEYFKAMFTQFNNFYQEQREDDLNFIQSSLLEINQKQAIQRQETDNAIASLYTSVSQGEKK